MIVGGGFAGLYCATTLRRLAPEAEVLVVERYPFFVSGPSQLDFVAGLTTLEGAARSYGPIAEKSIKVLRAEVTGVIPEQRKVVTGFGYVEYDQLVVATGIRLAEEDVLNLLDFPGANSHAWEIGEAIRTASQS